jgi:hypothetical protein
MPQFGASLKLMTLAKAKAGVMTHLQYRHQLQSSLTIVIYNHKYVYSAGSCSGPGACTIKHRDSGFGGKLVCISPSKLACDNRKDASLPQSLSIFVSYKSVKYIPLRFVVYNILR